MSLHAALARARTKEDIKDGHQAAEDLRRLEGFFLLAGLTQACSALWRLLSGSSARSCGGQQGQSGEVAGGHGQCEPGADAFDAAQRRFCHAADGLGPAEGEKEQTTIRAIVVPTQVNLLSAFLRQGVAGVAGGAGVVGKVAELSGNMWGVRGGTRRSGGSFQPRNRLARVWRHNRHCPNPCRPRA